MVQTLPQYVAKVGLSALSPDRQALAAHHIGLVRVHLRSRLRFRRKTRTARRDIEELFQAGCLALVQTAARYDPARDGPFAAYVLPRIRRAIHQTLLSNRSLVRIPYGAACRKQHTTIRHGDPGRHCWPAADLNAAQLSDRIDQPGNETIRHALRRRFELAARRALESLNRQTWRRSDTAAIFARITAERILVSNAQKRMPVRRLAEELGVSSGQVTEYEHRILTAIREQLRDDAPSQLLVQLAGQDQAGFDAPVDAARQHRLRLAEVGQFERRFAALDANERARVLYSLVEKSAGQVGEVARNLFLLTSITA